MLIDARYELIDEDRIEDTDGILITGMEYIHYQDVMKKYYELSSKENAKYYGWMDELEGYPPPKTYFYEGKSYTNNCAHN